MNYIKTFSELSKNDAHIAGGKGASLGEMLQHNIPVPDGYVLSADTFDHFLSETDLTQELQAILHTVDTKAIHTVQQASDQIQTLINAVDMPEDIATEIMSSFNALDTEYVAVRSSATAEDGADHAWAGQLDSYLNTTKENLLEMVQSCWASLFTPRAIFYRFEKGLHTTHISVAVVIQKMVNSEKSGIAFSVHPVTEDYNQIIIEAGFGLGEAIVSGSVTPDSYVVTKEPLDTIDINVNTQNKALYRSTTLDPEHGFNEWKDLSTTEANEQVLNEEQIKELSNIIVTIENHYGFPCDIEWACEDDTFYIVQSRPITTLKNTLESASKTEFFDKQISLTEWLGNMNHEDSTKHRHEDNEKRERLAVLNDIIGVPFDRPVQFQLVDVVGQSVEFQKYINEHGDDKCALRLIPLEKGLKKLRMRGKTVREVTEGWLNEQDIDPTKYRADYVPHSDVSYWSMTFIVSDEHIVGEIIQDSHEKLTQGYYTENQPITFTYDFQNWSLTTPSKAAQQVLEKAISFLKVEDEKQEILVKKLDAKFSHNYLKGYFESVDRDDGFLFIDYNRLIDIDIKKSDLHIASGGISGVIASSGYGSGPVRIVTDPYDTDFKQGDVLVCDMTSPVYLPLMQKAAAIITNRGGITSHAAIVARELGIPCVVVTQNATEILKDGDIVEVDTDKNILKVVK